MLGVPSDAEDCLEPSAGVVDRTEETPVEKDPWDTVWEEIVAAEQGAFEKRLQEGFTPDEKAYTGLTITDHAI